MSATSACVLKTIAKYVYVSIVRHSLHRSPRICVFVSVLEIMQLGFFFAFFASSFFLRSFTFSYFCFLVFFFLRSHENGCRSRRISFSSLPCNLTLLLIKNQNNL